MKYIILLMFCCMSFGCFTVTSKEDSVEKAKKIYEMNKADFLSIERMCDSFILKYPNDSLEMSYTPNSKSFLINHRKGTMFPGDREVFDNGNLGISYLDAVYICDRNKISSIQIDDSSAHIMLNSLNASSYNIFIVYSLLKDYDMNVSTDDGTWVQRFAEKYYVVWVPLD